MTPTVWLVASTCFVPIQTGTGAHTNTLAYRHMSTQISKYNTTSYNSASGAEDVSLLVEYLFSMQNALV